jgi:hypothetical protein
MPLAGVMTRQQQEGTMISQNIYTPAFREYKKIGLDPLPIPYDENGHPTKGPRIDGWQIIANNGG